MTGRDPRKHPRSPYRRVLFYALGHWRGWTAILILTLLSSALAILQPWPMQVLVDHVLYQLPIPPALGHLLSQVGVVSQGGLILLVVGAGLLIFALGSVLEAFLAIGWVRVGQKMVYDLMGDLFGHVERRGPIYHTRNSVGDSMNRITGDAWCVHSIIEAVIFSPTQSMLMIVSVTLVMLQIDLTLTLMALAIAPIMAAASFFRRKSVRAAAKLHREIQSSIHAHVQQILSGIPVVQAFTQEERERERFEQFAGDAISAQRRNAAANQVSSLLVGLASTLGTAFILYVGANRVIEKHLTVGTLLVFLAYLGTLQGHMRALAGIYLKLQGLRPSVDRINELFDDDVVQDLPGAQSMERAQGQVVLEGVTFGYEPGRPVLHNVSLQARPGQTIAIVGPTGAGKSTLAGLLLRFFDPASGRVLLDGHDLRSLRLADLRRQMALVLQEPFLFPRTIAENIAYGRPGASPAQVRAAAEAANAHEFIAKLPQSYDTLIGERGATLSGGQRQRLAIARALLKDAPVLILDEPTSALDAGTESLLLEALGRLMAGRTTFIIAHRLSTIRNADLIVVLQDGRIVETGNHQQLLANPALYAKLYALSATSPQGIEPNSDPVA